MHLDEEVKVNGPAADEVFLFLKAEAPCQIKWNFGAYFVVDGAGTVESFAGVHPRDPTARLDAPWPDARRHVAIRDAAVPPLCGAAADFARRRASPPGACGV